MKTLNFIPTPLPNESPTSVIKRLCLRNGYSKVKKFEAFHFAAGQPKVCPLLQGSRFERFLVANSTESLQEQVKKSFYSTTESTWGYINIGKLHLSRRLLRPVDAALCTECVNDGWEHIVKDNYLTSHCPIHNRHYLFTCPKCERQLSWQNQLTSYCDCGELLISPPCSWTEALPEQRLMELFEIGDQPRFDRVISIIRHLGIDLKTVSTASVYDVFAAATALVFDDVERATLSLYNTYNIPEPLETEIVLSMLQPVIPTFTIDLLQEQISKLPLREQPFASKILIPPRIMPELLHLSMDQWDILKNYTNIQKLRSAREGRHSYTVEELEQIAREIRSSGPVDKKQKLEIAIRDGLYYELKAARNKLSVSQQHFSYLMQHNMFGKKQVLNSNVYLPRDLVDDFANNHIRTATLGRRLKVSSSTIHLALQRLSINYPLFANWYGPPFFICIEDIPAIEETIRSSPLNKSTSIPASRRVLRSPSTPVVTLTKAASILHVHAKTIEYYRDIGTLSHHPESLSLVSYEDVLKFHQNFATPSDLGQELNISSRVVTRVLQRLGISPMAGPFVTGTPSHVFDRSKLPADLKYRVNPYNDDFGMHWLRKEVSTTTEIAKELGLSLTDTAELMKRFIKPTRAPCYQHYQAFSPKDKEKLQALLHSLVPLSGFLAAHSMSHHIFTRRFTNPGFVNKIKIGGVEYLTRDDCKKINSLMSEYCTTMEADKILGLTRGGGAKRIKRLGIRPHFLPHYNYKYPLYKIDELLALKNGEHTKR